MPKTTKTKLKDDFDINKVKISVSFTKEEIDWLSWVMADVLKTYTFKKAARTTRTKISTATRLFLDIDAMGQKFIYDATKRKKSRRNGHA